VTTKELAAQVVEQLRGTPFVLALLVINIIVLAGFAFMLHEVGNAIERSRNHQGLHREEQIMIASLIVLVVLDQRGLVRSEQSAKAPRQIAGPARAMSPAGSFETCRPQ
jgi:hypothetical protein